MTDRARHGLCPSHDLPVHLAGDGATRAPTLTPVQADVLVRLGNAVSGTACVGRGLPFKCNRITARALADLGLVRIDGNTFARNECYVLTLTNAGRARATALTKGDRGRAGGAAAPVEGLRDSAPEDETP